jgi:type IV pilus assembly protein PilP
MGAKNKMKRQDLIQIFTFALVAVVGVGAAFLLSLKFLTPSRAQDGAPPPVEGGQPPAESAAAPAAPPAEGPPAEGPPPAATPNAEALKQLQQVPIGGESAFEALQKAQDSAAAREAEAAAIVGMPAVDPNAGRTQVQPEPGDGSGAQGADQGAAPSGGMTGISELEGFLEPFIYDEVNRRDPFLAYGVAAPTGETEAPRILAPIQKFPLSDFRLVGVLWDVKTPKAMVVTSNNELFIVERDQSIGIDNGYVAAIRESEIVVVEPVKKRGDVTYKTTVLRMER